MKLISVSLLSLFTLISVAVFFILNANKVVVAQITTTARKWACSDGVKSIARPTEFADLLLSFFF
jgi:hypothetical protein